MKIIAQNKKARYDFQLQEFFEAGLVLQGTEVKSLRESQCQIAESYVTIDSKGEMWLYNMRIPHYQFGTYANHEEFRKRKLLMHRKEIEKIAKELQAKGLTLVPTKIYFKNSRVKIEVALAKGKNLHDKRQSEVKKSVERKLRQGNYDD